MLKFVKIDLILLAFIYYWFSHTSENNILKNQNLYIFMLQSVKQGQLNAEEEKRQLSTICEIRYDSIIYKLIMLSIVWRSWIES